MGALKGLRILLRHNSYDIHVSGLWTGDVLVSLKQFLYFFNQSHMDQNVSLNLFTFIFEIKSHLTCWLFLYQCGATNNHTSSAEDCTDRQCDALFNTDACTRDKHNGTTSLFYLALVALLATIGFWRAVLARDELAALVVATSGALPVTSRHLGLLLVITPSSFPFPLSVWDRKEKQRKHSSQFCFIKTSCHKEPSSNIGFLLIYFIYLFSPF